MFAKDDMTRGPKHPFHFQKGLFPLWDTADGIRGHDGVDAIVLKRKIFSIGLLKIKTESKGVGIYLVHVPDLLARIDCQKVINPARIVKRKIKPGSDPYFKNLSFSKRDHFCPLFHIWFSTTGVVDDLG